MAVRLAPRSMWLEILACCLLASSALEPQRGDLYMDLLLQTEGILKEKESFYVPGMKVRVDGFGASNPEITASFKHGTLLNSGIFERSGDCKGPTNLAASAYIQCPVTFRGFKATYQGDRYHHFTAGLKVHVSVEANILDSMAKVEFRHFSGNKTEEVRVTVDEVRVFVTDLEPVVDYFPQQVLFRQAVESNVSKALSDMIPNILADHLILAMESVVFPLPQ